MTYVYSAIWLLVCGPMLYAALIFFSRHFHEHSQGSTADEHILVRAAPEVLNHLAKDGSGPVLLIGAERQDDGTWELVFRKAET